MVNKIYYVLILTFLLLLSIKVHADNRFPIKQSDKPMEITSDRMEIFKDKKLVVFSGNAKVTQGNSLLKADKLSLYYRDEPDKKYKIGTIQTGKAGDLERIEARGNVYLNYEEKIATGNEAIYFRDSGKVIMVGNASLKEGENCIKGESVIVFLDENRGIIEGNTQKQVKAVIYPKDIKNRNKIKQDYMPSYNYE
ncbi:MAG: lipopolysaccharide transport periplasmic protein LptA [Syntrophaceae bacterium]|nr:lipopolysaccharide transport periplasmic protein LptA [Syntrophaceae bacterium]